MNNNIITYTGGKVNIVLTKEELINKMETYWSVQEKYNTPTYKYWHRISYIKKVDAQQKLFDKLTDDNWRTRNKAKLDSSSFPSDPLFWKEYRDTDTIKIKSINVKVADLPQLMKEAEEFIFNIRAKKALRQPITPQELFDLKFANLLARRLYTWEQMKEKNRSYLRNNVIHIVDGIDMRDNLAANPLHIKANKRFLDNWANKLVGKCTGIIIKHLTELSKPKSKDDVIELYMYEEKLNDE